MSKLKIIPPLLNLSVEQLLYIFLTEKYISNPMLIGICSFSIEELKGGLFDRVGYDDFFMYEKCFTITSTWVNVKNYFHNGEFLSNGVDIGEGRICSIFSKLHAKYDSTFHIESIELLLDDSFEYGSLIINRFLDVRFGVLNEYKVKKKFHMIGISSDYELPTNSIEREGNTHAARVMKNKFTFQYALKKFKDNPAINELVLYMTKNFPNAVL